MWPQSSTVGEIQTSSKTWSLRHAWCVILVHWNVSHPGLAIVILNHLGVSCRCDISCTEEATNSTGSLAQFAAAKGLIHAGGILKDATIARQTAQHIREVYAPKHYGAVNLAKVSLATSLNLTGTFILPNRMTGTKNNQIEKHKAWAFNHKKLAILLLGQGWREVDFALFKTLGELRLITQVTPA